MYDFLPILTRIKKAKTKAGFTNEELSARSGISIGTINKILSGDTKEPKLPALIAITAALNVSADYLIHGDKIALSKTDSSNDNELSSEEWEVIKQYRYSNDDIKSAVRRVIGIKDK